MKHVIFITGKDSGEVEALSRVLIFDGCQVVNRAGTIILVYKTGEECVKAIDRGYYYLAKLGNSKETEHVPGQILSVGTALAKKQEMPTIHVEG
jgi:regulatory protein YycH of two-component signal transduction system YycFG